MDINNIIQNNNKVLLLFSGSFCNPCKKILPFFIELSNIYNNIKFVKIDVNEYDELADNYNVKFIPHFIYFENGMKIKEYTGISEKEILNLIK